tara:strand:+ start:364 stop:570 length:207 start_codon:yes stop_codon:yes gene_type:complete
MNTQTLAFIKRVSRINESIHTVRASIDTLIEDLEAGKAVLEECKVDKGSHGTSIRISYWKEGEHATRA